MCLASLQQDTIPQLIGNSYSRKGYFLCLREDCLLFPGVLCYDNKNEMAGISALITAGKRPRRYPWNRSIVSSVSWPAGMEPGNWFSSAPGPGEIFTSAAILTWRCTGCPPENRTSFWLDAEELPTLLKLDIVHVAPEFLSNIEKDGVILYAAES